MVKKSNQKNKNKKKAQGSLETLLLFGGAILLAAIVISLIVGIGSSSKKSAEENTNRAITMSDTVIPPILHSVSCADTTCDVFFQSFSNGTNELVIDKNVDGRTEITDNKTTIASALTIGEHSAYILTTLNGGSAMSNTYRWEARPLGTVATPVANPSGGTINGHQTIVLQTTTPEATICYSLSSSSALSCNLEGGCASGTTYAVPFSILPLPRTLRAIGCKKDWLDSTILIETYTLNVVSPPIGELPIGRT